MNQPAAIAPDPMLETARACSIALSLVPLRFHAPMFVELKIAFMRHHGRGLVCSTIHGTEFFDNVVACCEGRLVWDKYVEKGEYGDNFRKLIAERPRA